MLDIPEEAIQTRFKGTRILHTKKIPIRDSQGQPQYILGISEDITEKKRVDEERIRLAQEQEARIEAEKGIQLRDDFLSIAAHELRTPLTPMRMNLQLIKNHVNKLDPSLPKMEFLRKAIQGTDQEFERFLKLVENLLDVSRISAGRLVLDRHEFDLPELVREVIGRFDAEIKKAKCEVRFHSQGNVVGRWDRARIEQVVTNLLSNATKYGANKPIEITVLGSETKALIQFQDFGIGISKADQDKLFHRFERLAPIKHFGGFGLGLFIAHEIVEAHGGIIRLESELGTGSIFTVELPIS
jgi:signal transduction histidine kinase